MSRPWLRSAGGAFLYAFSSAGDEYVLRVTDMGAVYEERLGARAVEARGERLRCPFALDSARQRGALAAMLAGLLASDAAAFEAAGPGALAVAVRAAGDVPFEWRFELRELAPAAAAAVFAALATQLYAALQGLGGHAAALAASLADAGALVRGLEHANSRQVPYQVPGALKPAYSAALRSETPPQLPTDAVALAHEFWPAQAAPVVAAAAETDDEATDSDATHESATSGDMWAQDSLP